MKRHDSSDEGFENKSRKNPEIVPIPSGYYSPSDRLNSPETSPLMNGSQNHNGEDPTKITLPPASSMMKEVDPFPNSPHQPYQPPGDNIDDAEQEKQMKQKHAMDFLYKVRDQYSNKPNIYNEFLEIMKGFKSGSIETPQVIERVKDLFRGNDYLIEEFNLFLPPGYKIEPERGDSQPPLAQASDLEQARSYVRKIKSRFSLQPHIYKTFLEILHSYYQGQHSINEVLSEVADLFQNHQDLLSEFKHFLPKSTPAATTAASPPLARPSTQPHPPPVTKKSKPAEKKRKGQEKQDRHLRYDKQDRIRREERRATTPVVEEYRPEKKQKKEERRRQHQIEKRLAPDKGFYKEFNFFSELKDRIQSKYLYHELLSCINLYSQEIITRGELMYLANELLSMHRDLYEMFKQFIGFPDPSSITSDKFQETKSKEIEINSKDQIDQLDAFIEANQETLEALEERKKFYEDKENEDKLLPLDVIHIQALETLYGQRGAEIIDAIIQNPLSAIPIVMTRLRLKNEEWMKLKEEILSRPDPEPEPEPVEQKQVDSDHQESDKNEFDHQPNEYDDSERSESENEVGSEDQEEAENQ